MCALSSENGNDLGLLAVLILTLRSERRGSSCEAAAERSASAARVLADAASGALSEGCMRPLVMLAVGRAREAAAPSRVGQELSVEPLSSAWDDV